MTMFKRTILACVLTVSASMAYADDNIGKDDNVVSNDFDGICTVFSINNIDIKCNPTFRVMKASDWQSFGVSYNFVDEKRDDHHVSVFFSSKRSFIQADDSWDYMINLIVMIDGDRPPEMTPATGKCNVIFSDKMYLDCKATAKSNNKNHANTIYHWMVSGDVSEKIEPSSKNGGGHQFNLIPNK